MVGKYVGTTHRILKNQRCCRRGRGIYSRLSHIARPSAPVVLAHSLLYVRFGAERGTYP